MRQGKFDLNHLKRKRRQVQYELKELTEYFGIDTVKSKPMEVFSTVKQFIKDLTTASENITKKALFKKNSSRAMIRSASTPNFKRSSRNSSSRGSRNSSAKSSRNSSARSSIRRSSRNGSFVSTAAESQSEEKDDGRPAICDHKRSFTLSKISPSEISNFSQQEKYSVGETAPISEEKNYRNSRPRYFDKDVHNGLKEPDLEKYRSLMKEYERKRKSIHSIGEVDKAILDANNNTNNESHSEAFEGEHLKRVLQSTVKMEAPIKNEVALSKNICNGEQNVEQIRTEDQLGYRISTSNESKRFHENIMELESQRKLDILELADRSKERKSGKGNECTLNLKVGNATDEVKDYAFERRNLQQITGSKQDRPLIDRLELNRSRSMPSTNGSPEELKTLHYKAKSPYSMKTYRSKEINMEDKSRHHSHLNSQNKSKEHWDSDNNGGWQIDTKYHNNTMQNRTETAGLQSGIPISEHVGLEQDWESREQSNASKQRDAPQSQVAWHAKENADGSNTAVCWKKEVHRCGGDSIIMGAMEINNNKTDAMTAVKKSNTHGSFVRGSTRNSFKRSSLRKSGSRERSIRKVNVKAIQAKELEKANASSKSESHLEHGGLQRRRTKSDGIQAVTLKPGFITKALPIKLEQTITPSSTLNDEPKNSMKTDNLDQIAIPDKSFSNSTSRKESEISNSCQVTFDDSFDTEKSNGPVLRRTKSAVISRNLREAKLIFLL